MLPRLRVCSRRRPLHRRPRRPSAAHRRRRDHRPRRLRIILSAGTDDGGLIDSINRGEVYRYYTKPWDAAELRNNLRQAFRHYGNLQDARTGRRTTGGHSEDSVRLEAALRHGLGSRGVPRSIYVDNGSAFVAAPLLRACAVLGIRLVHSRPGRAEGRGQDRTVLPDGPRPVPRRDRRRQRPRRIGDLVEMNRLFAAWVETAYHRRAHSETNTAPLERFVAGGPFPIPTPTQLHEAFLCKTTSGSGKSWVPTRVGAPSGSHSCRVAWLLQLAGGRPSCPRDG